MVDKERNLVGKIDSRDGRKQIDLEEGFKDVNKMVNEKDLLVERMCKDVNKMEGKSEEMDFIDLVDVKIRKDVYERVLEIEEGEEISDAIENIVARMESLEQELDEAMDSQTVMKEDLESIREIVNQYGE